MRIGSALKKERLRMGLTQDEMIQGIIKKSHYSKVERNLEGISADSLFEILFAHNIDIDNFLDQIKDEYRSVEGKKAIKLNQEVIKAFNESATNKMQEKLHDILQLKGQTIFKYRAIVSVAILSGQLNLLSPDLKKQIFLQFAKYDNWFENVDALRLLANCLPIFKIEQLDNVINQLLRHYSKNRSYSERMIERIAIICNNYLYYCFYSNVEGKNISACLKFLSNLDCSYHFLFYHIAGKFYLHLFKDEKNEARKIKKQLISYGYKNLVSSWRM